MEAAFKKRDQKMFSSVCNKSPNNKIRERYKLKEPGVVEQNGENPIPGEEICPMCTWSGFGRMVVHQLYLGKVVYLVSRLPKAI